MRCTICGWLIKSWPGTDWPTAPDNECRWNKITGHDTIHSGDRTRIHWPWNIQFKVQERLSPCDRSHSNQNANWIRSCRQTEKIVRNAVAGGAVVGGSSTQTTFGSAPFVSHALWSGTQKYSVWDWDCGIPCYLGCDEVVSCSHGRIWMTKRGAACLHLQRGQNVYWTDWSRCLLVLWCTLHAAARTQTERDPLKHHTHWSSQQYI